MHVRLLLVLTLASVCASRVSAQQQNSTAAKVCPGEPSAYLGRTVADVRVTSPFDFIHAVKKLEELAAETLPLKKGEPFDANAYSDGTTGLKTYIRTRLPSGLIAFRFVAASGLLEPMEEGPADCSSGPVRVHYVVFTAVLPRTSANLSEIAQALIERPTGTAGSLSSSGFLKILPKLNYNQTRHVFAGLTLDQALPLKVFDHIQADPALSSNSTTGTIELTGSANPAMKYLNRANWQFGSQYYDVPVDSAWVTKSLLSAEGFGSTRQLDSTITLRWGAELGGGHVQDSTADTANSSYGEAKLLAGLEAQRGTFNASLTYGLEIADSFSISSGLFEKHIFDARLAWTYTRLPQYVTSHGHGNDDRRNFIGVPHHPLTIETQANGGLLAGSAAVPAVERFFGGNQAQPFIPGQPWDALGQAYIRSIPENRLGSDTGTAVIGGDRFYSVNLTVAKALWGKALLPRSLANRTSPGSMDFLDALDGGIATTKGELSDTYYSKDPNVMAVANTLGSLDDDIAALKAAIKALPPGLLSLPNVIAIKRDLNGFLIGVTSSLELIKKGQGRMMPYLINTQFPGLEGDLVRLANAARDAGDTASEAALQAQKARLDGPLRDLKTRWDQLDTKSARAKADAHAAADFVPAESVLNKLLYTLNAYSIAPVAVFDVARLWPEQHGTRYAPGAGVRLSVVNANFTFGYAYNPIQANHEGAGAVFFKLDFTDLFR